MKKINWRILFSIILILSSVLMYSAHYFIFNDSHHIFIYLVGDLAFIPLEVLLVSFVIDKVIEARERTVRLEKLNLVIGLFFNEVGTKVLTCLVNCDENIAKISNKMHISKEWTEREYKLALQDAKKHTGNITVHNSELEEINAFLQSKRDFMLKLLENQNLMEHESFTQLLYALFHLEEELSTRDLSSLDLEDREHLKIDMKRIYDVIIMQYLLYMKYLKNTFPYFYKTALEVNPFLNNHPINQQEPNKEEPQKSENTN